MLNYRNIIKVFDSDFKESEHPRDKDGKFTTGNGTHGSGASQSKSENPFAKENITKWTPETTKHYDELKKAAENTQDVKEFIRNKENMKMLKENGIKNTASASKMYRDMLYDRPVETHEISYDEIADTIHKNIPNNVLFGWFANEDSSYKGRLENIVLHNDDVRNASLNLAYMHYKNQMHKERKDDEILSFEDFLDADIPVYRGKRSERYVEGDDLIAFSFDKKIALGFVSGQEQYVRTEYIKPRDTLGSFQNTGEKEILVRRN